MFRQLDGKKGMGMARRTWSRKLQRGRLLGFDDKYFEVWDTMEETRGWSHSSFTKEDT